MKGTDLLAVVAPSMVGLVGVLTSGPHTAVAWAALLGLGQGGQLSLALTMVNLRPRDAATTANLSTAEAIGRHDLGAGPRRTTAQRPQFGDGKIDRHLPRPTTALCARTGRVGR